MLRTLFLIDRFLSKIDTISPVFISRDGYLCVSGFSTLTKQVCFFIRTNFNYTDDLFAVRNWKSLSTILHSIDVDKTEVLLEKNKDGYPYRLVFKSGRSKITYYLQTKQIISNEYKSFSFNVDNPASYQDLPEFDDELIKSFMTATKITLVDTFSLNRVDNELFAIFGDKNSSVDNVEIKLLDNCNKVDIPPLKLYNTADIINLIKVSDNPRLCMISNDKIELISTATIDDFEYTAGFIFSSKTRI